MREETLQHLKHIVDALNKNEKEVLVEYLKAFDSRSDGYKPKTLIILDLLLKNNDLSKVSKYLKKKFGAKSEDALRMMMYRLKEKIGEICTFFSKKSTPIPMHVCLYDIL